MVLFFAIFVMSGCKGESTDKGAEPAITTTPQSAVVPPPAIAPPQMDLAELERQAREVRDQLLQKREEIEKLITEKAAIPIAEQMSEEAKDLAEQIMEYREDLAQLSQDLDQSIKELREAGKDTSSLEMDE